MSTTEDIPNVTDLNISEKWAPQLGYAEEPETPLTADTFPSKSGGKPAWLNPEKILSINDVTCGLCEQPMVLLVQLYTPEDFPPEAFHRTVYVFCCKNGTCVKQDWKKCFKVYRSQLPRENSYYPPPPENEEDDEEEIEFIPKKYKSPTLCVICGIEGTKACGQCKSVHYCSREHQMVDWNMCLHKQFCKKINNLTPTEQQQIEKLRQQRIFQEMEIVSEAEGRGEDGIEEDAQLQHTLENSKNDNDENNTDPTAKALVPIGEEQEEDDTQVDVDDTFLKFQLRIQLYPEQILRYDRVEYDMPDCEPLWVQDDQKPPATIPTCEQCGGPRTFEFQLLSTLLNFLGVSHLASDSLDWGSLYIYSCKRNCSSSQVFMPEFIWKQDFSSHGMKLGGTSGQ
ncbi:programmed cell death protein 2 [Cunninghamella echinulata]|nr:programmed cell death protein 2 [Cunninghamella echinulata]